MQATVTVNDSMLFAKRIEEDEEKKRNGREVTTIVAKMKK